MSEMWIRKYVPNNSSELIGLEKEVELVKKSIQNHKKGAKATFLYGGIGNGKTVTIQALAQDLNYELVELNASDSRKQSELVELLSSVANQGSLFGTGKIILIDELEGLSGMKDRGAIAGIAKIIPSSNYPIILIAHDAYSDKLKAVKKLSNLIEFKPRSSEAVFSILKTVCDKEKIVFDEAALKQLARISGGDVRCAINDLQTISTGSKKITSDSVSELGERNVTKNIEEALHRVFKTTNAEVALGAYDDINEDLDKIFLWVEQNLPKEYLKPNHLSDAFDNLSLADVFYGRIRRWQYYRFYVYCYNLLSAGIAIVKDKKYSSNITYQPSSRLLKIWMANMKNVKRKAIAQKIATATHTSSRVAFNSAVPFIQVIFQNDKKQAEKLAKEFDFDSEEIAWLKK